MTDKPRNPSDSDKNVSWEDTYDDVIVNADDTGLVATERFITDAEIEEALEKPLTGDNKKKSER